MTGITCTSILTRDFTIHYNNNLSVTFLTFLPDDYITNIILK